MNEIKLTIGKCEIRTTILAQRMANALDCKVYV